MYSIESFRAILQLFLEMLNNKLPLATQTLK